MIALVNNEWKQNPHGSSYLENCNIRDIDEKCSLKELLRKMREEKIPSLSTVANGVGVGDGDGSMVQDQERKYPDESLKRSRARLSSQELFLSVVLDWQNNHSSTPMKRCSMASSMSSSSSSPFDSAASSLSDSELEETTSAYVERMVSKRKVTGSDEISPTTVAVAPGDLTPLRLNYSSTKRIGIYTPRARKQLLQKYMDKRQRRLSQKKVRYGVRKTLANARPRVKGRFVKTEQPLTAAIVQAMTTKSSLSPPSSPDVSMESNGAADMLS